MSVVGDIKSGLKTRLETISGVRVYANPHDAINQFPSAVIFVDSIEYPITFAGTASAGTLRVVFLSDSAVTEQAVRDLDKYLHPSNGSSVMSNGASRSSQSASPARCAMAVVPSDVSIWTLNKPSARMGH